jgi:hypothetical protein
MGKRFCRKPCKTGHVQRRRQVRSARILHWLRVLSLADSFSLRNALGSAGKADPRPSDLVLIPIASDSRRVLRPVRALAKIHNH